MAKILKNNTASSVDVNDVGQSVPASLTLTINPSDYALFAASDDVISLIGAGTLTVNDGLQDLSIAEAVGLIQGSFIKRDFVDTLKESNRLKVDVTGTLGDGQVKVTASDAAAEFLDSKIVAGSTKLSKTVINGGSTEAIQLDVVPSNINTADLNNNANFIDSSGAPVQPSDISNFETSSQLNTRDASNRNRANHTGVQTVSTISDFTTGVQNSETVTNLTFNNTTKILTFTNESGTAQNVDLTQFLDDTNLALITSGTLNSSTGIATFTRDDSTSFDVDFSSLNDQAAINTAISTHETTISNHDDVDVTTVTPNTGDLLSYDGTNWIPKRKQYKKHVRTVSGQINQTTSFDPFLTLSDTIPVTGSYKVSWSYSWSLNSTGNDFIAQVQVNNSDTIHSHQQEVKDSAGTGVNLPNTSGGTTNSSTNQRYTNSGFDVVTISAGSFTVDLDWRCEVSDIEPAIYKATLTIEEWEE